MREFDRALPMMLYRALEAVQPRFRAIFTRFGLTETQWRVLRVLWEHDGMGHLDLSRATLIPAPSLVGVIDRLERDRLVNRTKNETDRRKIGLFLTDAGRALQSTVQPLIDQTYVELEGSLSDEQWRALYGAIDALCAGHKQSAKV